jgi:hypothetical protein
MKRMFLIFGFVGLRSGQMARLLSTVLILVLLSTTNVSAQLDTLWQAGAVTYEPDGCGGAFVFGGGVVVNYVGRVDSTGTYLWYEQFIPPEWKWRNDNALLAKAMIDYSKSSIVVWDLSYEWQDSNYVSHGQAGCAVWKFDSLGNFQWVVSTQFPDSESFWPYAASVDSNNDITILGGYNFESSRPCESLWVAALGIMRVSSVGAMSFDFVCGQPENVPWQGWPEDPRLMMTFSACYDNKYVDSCNGSEGGTFYSHTLYRYANDSIHTLPLELKDIQLQPCPSLDFTGYRPVENYDWGHGEEHPLVCDSAGNTFEILKEETVIYSSWPYTYSHRYLIAKYTLGGELAWMKPLSALIPVDYSTPPLGLAPDDEGGVAVGGPDGVRKFSSNGTLQWYVPKPEEITYPILWERLAVDTRKNVYVRFWNPGYNASWFMCLDAKSGKRRFLYKMGNLNFYAPLVLDSVGCIYGTFSENGPARLRQNMSFVMRDANGEKMPNQEFTLIRVSDDAPLFTEDTLGVFTTNDSGVYKFPMVVPDSFLFKEGPLDTDPDTLGVGDLFKVAKRAYDAPSVRHPGLVGTQYSVHLDNLHIDPDGAIAFDTVDGENYKNVVLGHTEYRYNLLVSVEWDAVEAYQQGLQEDFRQMSNYLYDVTDGQLRLDTVAIVDNGELWEEADVHIRASNVHLPDSRPDAISHAGWYPITMPRKWFGNEDDCRWFSYEDHPLAAAVSEDYRAKAHEFGHFALGFYDEYLFMDNGWHPLPATARCQPRPAGNYGFMDYEYDDDEGGVRSSEMSSRYRYTAEACRNTEQFIYNDTSCWDQFEEWAEGTFDGIYVPIRKPDQEDTLEHLTPSILDYIRGPNDNLAVLDYDVGAEIYFASPITPPDAANRSLNLYVSGVPAGGGQVTLKKNLPGGEMRVIEQGVTRDDGLIWVLGGSDGDNLQTYGRSYVIINPPKAAIAGEIMRQWLTGSLEVSAMVGDSGSITLQPIEGDYPLVLVTDISVVPQRWRLEFTQPFSQLPNVQFLSQSGQALTPSVAEVNGGYDTYPADTITQECQARLGAVDSAGNAFFVPFSYIKYGITDSTELGKLLGPDAAAILNLSSHNASITKVLIVASSYPPILNGLEADAIQAGDAYNTSVSPSVTLTGVNNLTIKYGDEDLQAGDSLIGDESLLRMYRWDEGGNSWVYIGGLVDTSHNSVTAEISSLGTYALFTTKSSSGVDDEPDHNLPYWFELSQNYPNPFNPVTTIEYSVPRRAQVTIEIFNILGRRVRTLVNENKSAGQYRIEWKGTDDSGNPVSTGVYLYRFQAGEVVQTKKMLLIK